MKTIKEILIVFLISVTWSSVVDAETENDKSGIKNVNYKQIRLLWRARGLQAIDKLVEFSNKKALSNTEKCQQIVEMAYSYHSDPEKNNVLLPTRTSVGFLINFDSPNGPLILVDYKGKNEAVGQVILFSVTNVNSPWGIQMDTVFPNRMFVGSDKCGFTVWKSEKGILEITASATN